jgi:valyl-tRNA synthetase
LAHSVDALYRFLWDYYADWYVEYLKTDSTSIPFAKELFKQYIALLYPYAPHECEALWREFFHEDTLLAFAVYDASWSSSFELGEARKVEEFEAVVDSITNLRSIRGLFGINPGTSIELHTDLDALNTYAQFIALTAKTSVVMGSKTGLYEVINRTGAVIGGIDVLKYISDMTAEIERTRSAIGQHEKNRDLIQGQLNNSQFLEKAAAEVVQEKRDQLLSEIAAIEKQMQKLAFLTGF